jgi:excinuclease ABC subunit C
MIPNDIKIKKNTLPDNPGVYFYSDHVGKLLYIGKATSLKRRVRSYFTKAHDRRIAELVSKIAKIDYIETPTVIEALVLEANQIKAHKPPYNILMADDKSFWYVTISKEDYPRVELMRGHDLKQLGVNPFRKTLSEKAKKRFRAIYGPYTSSRSLKTALKLLRKIIPWSDCVPGAKRPCFNAQIGLCAGVCTEAIGVREYKQIIKQLQLFLEGKKRQLVRDLKKAMKQAASKQEYEKAAVLRNRVFALEHIKDVALIQKDDRELIPLVEGAGIDLAGRIEGYDISNISGKFAVGSMVVFEEGTPAKNQYRKFKIKTVVGSDDVGCMEEVMRRRLRRAELYPNAWPLPELMVIDGGEGQVNRVGRVMKEMGVEVPLIGIAKGSDRKQDRLVYNRGDNQLLAIAERGKVLFQRVRDEAHRFAVSYHRQLRSKLT